MKGRSVKRRERGFALCRGLPVWLILSAAALVFTQLLRSPASALLFVFLLLIPPAMLIYLLLARAALGVYRISDDGTVEKNQPFGYLFRLVNASPLSYPFVDARLSLPTDDRLTCGRDTVAAGVHAFGAAEFSGEAAFPYRGTYEIGVESIRVCDLFRLFSIRIPIGLYVSVHVTPRVRTLQGQGEDASAQAAEAERKQRRDEERHEQSGVREYRTGDAQKSIHWKLSAHSDELIVREYQAGRTLDVTVLCDLTAHFPDPPPEPYPSGDPAALADPAFSTEMNLLAADGVIELATAVVLRELDRGNCVYLLWYDDRAPQGVFAERLVRHSDFDRIRRRFFSSPVGSAEHDAAALAKVNTTLTSAKQIFITPSLETAARIPAHTRPGVRSELLLFSPSARFANPELCRAQIDACLTSLGNAGVSAAVYDEIPDGTK